MMSVLPELDPRLLRAFVVVAQELHFSRAAERLGIAQPPLSQQIRRLEDKIGYPLFRRGTRRVELTEAGRVLLDVANTLFEQMTYGVNAVRRAGRGEVGRLRIGFPTSLALSVIPGAVRRYREQYPEVVLELHELATARQVEALHGGTIDVGFLREPLSHPTFGLETLYAEPILVAIGRDHMLARLPGIPLGSLAMEDFILFRRSIGSELYDRIIRLCHGHGFVPQIAQEVEDWQTIAALVGAGLGIALVPASITRLQLDDVVYRPLDPPNVSTNVVMCWRKDKLAPVVDRFLEIARACLSSGRPAA
ncbi:MAG: LysR family transcriptional regulator [Zavarzinia sp.]|nr:LysR family transcriptional regulator [Zavarzinia sp.]